MAVRCDIGTGTISENERSEGREQGSERRARERSCFSEMKVTS